MTHVLKATSDADFLSLVPTLAGYHATNSLVCVAFGGSRSINAFRLSLPQRRRLSDYRAVASWVTGALNRIPGATGVVFVVYTDATFADERGIPWLDFSRHLVKRMDSEGFETRNSLCVAADGWASYFDRDYPRDGRPLSDIVVDPTVQTLDGLAELPVVSSEERSRFARALAELNDCAELPERLAYLADHDQFSLVELVATWDDGLLPEGVAACLTLMAQSPAARDEIMLQFAFGELVAQGMAEKDDHFLQLQRERGGSMDDVVRAEVAAGRASLDDEIAGLLMGVGRIRPDPERLECGIRHLRWIIAVAPERYQLGPLCILAWMLWARGLGSAAGAFLDRALTLDPHYGMAQVLASLLNGGRLPEWTYG
jgi:hypothetical protein